jgi:sulfur-oxidizing protein SoxZ
MADARIQLPPQIRRDEAFEVKILVRHPMETGFRLTDDGKRVPRNVIKQFVCRYNGADVFRAEPGSGIAANPLFVFFITARDSGELVFEWSDDAGGRWTERVPVRVAG